MDSFEWVFHAAFDNCLSEIGFNLSRVFIYSITESEIAPLKSQLEELDTEITEMVSLKVVLIEFSAREQVSEVSGIYS